MDAAPAAQRDAGRDRAPDVVDAGRQGLDDSQRVIRGITSATFGPTAYGVTYTSTSATDSGTDSVGSTTS